MILVFHLESGSYIRHLSFPNLVLLHTTTTTKRVYANAWLFSWNLFKSNHNSSLACFKTLHVKWDYSWKFFNPIFDLTNLTKLVSKSKVIWYPMHNSQIFNLLTKLASPHSQFIFLQICQSYSHLMCQTLVPIYVYGAVEVNLLTWWPRSYT